MRRIVILGRGGAGKSTLAEQLERTLGLPRTELDSVFWNQRVEPLPNDAWVELQRHLTAADTWILDGDLGPYDVVEPRLQRADTVVVLDLALWRGALRALRRGRERRDFWIWTIGWRRRDRPRLIATIQQHAPSAELVRLRTPDEVARWLATIER